MNNSREEQMTLERILEPEVMDSMQDAQEYNDMDHQAVNQRFVADLTAFAASLQETETDLELGDVLDLGTGTAMIPVELCKQHEDCRVMAVDLAVNMLELAIYNIEVAGVAERITLAQVDAKQMAYEDGMFDIAMSNSIVHHIPHPMDCLKEMVRVTNIDGILFVRDLMRPSDQKTLDELVQTHASDGSEYSRKLFRDSLHAALSLTEIRELISELGFAADTVQATSDRHWTWAAVKDQ